MKPICTDLGSILRGQALATPDRPFLTFTEDPSPLTYGAFDAFVDRVANGLRALGVTRGDFVNVMLPNRAEYLAVAYAIKRLGAVEVAINSEFKGPALTRMLGLSGGRLLVTDDQAFARSGALVQDVRAIDTVVLVGADALPPAGRLRLVPFAELDAAAAEDPGVAVSDLAPASVIFTSGTTGPSKGCLLPHRALVRAAEVVRDALELSADDCLYTPYPLFHMRAAYLDVLAPILVGGQAVIAPRFSASRFWPDIHRFDVSVFSLLGTVMQILWKREPDALERGHRVRLTWGGPLPVDGDAFHERFGVRVLPGDGVFGMSETGMLNMSSFDPRTSGVVRPIFDVRIGDDDGAALPAGATGEILVRPVEPGAMFSGYLNDPAATVEACEGFWFHTGDLGTMDADRRLRFVGRKREMIRRGGNNISTWEIEEVIDAHDDVLESAAIGIPSPLGEQEVKVFVTLRPDAELDADALLDYCRETMASFMVPQHLVIVPALPKTQTGKVAKAELARM